MPGLMLNAERFASLDGWRVTAIVYDFDVAPSDAVTAIVIVFVPTERLLPPVTTTVAPGSTAVAVTETFVTLFATVAV